MTEALPTFTPPSRSQALWFWLRIRLLTLQRIARDAVDAQLATWPAQPAGPLRQAPVRASISSPLWTDGRADEFVLVAGKVHNLRRAVPAFHAIEVPAHATFSFWQQLGRATAARGFVWGREVREGCVTPAIAGGICQLSNAIYTAALQAGLTVRERHGHTARVEQAEHSGLHDATVLWKHIDLRLAAEQAWRLEVHMDAEQLHVAIRSAQPLTGTAAPTPRTTPAAVGRRIAIHAQPNSAARGCLTCDETQCFRHAPELAGLASARATRRALLDAMTPELGAHLRTQAANAQTSFEVVLPHSIQNSDGMPPIPLDEFMHHDTSWRARWLGLKRKLWLRLNARTPGRRQASIAQVQAWQARHAALALRPTDVEVLVDQAHLPTLWPSGVLAGRRLQVWMPALPMQAITAALDAAATRWPDEPSLRDFRIAPDAVQAELDALQAAHTIVTPHHAVAQWARTHLRAQVQLVPWQYPALKQKKLAAGPANSPMLVMLCSTLPRKGSRELAAALHALQPTHPLRLGVLGSLPQAPSAALQAMWQSLAPVALGYGSDWVAQASVAVLPAHVEHAPRAALMALAAGIPVIATPACGLPPQAGLTLVDAGDVPALVQALTRALTTAPAAPVAPISPAAS